MNIRLRDRLGLVVVVMLYPSYDKDNGVLSHMRRDKNGTLWVYLKPQRAEATRVILNKDHTCSAAKLRPDTLGVSKIIGSTDSHYRWKLLRDHIADEKRKKKEEKKRKKDSVVKRKHIKHIIADWVVEDL